MRLSSQQIDSIINGVNFFLQPDTSAELFLFGSQTDDSSRGGDIDLALIIEDLSALEKIKIIDYKILAKIKSEKSIGDRRIDLKIIGTAEKSSAFFSIALKNAISLKIWGF